MGEHVIFFDAECVLCQRAVRYIQQIDESALFLFAPLNGKTAARTLTGPNARLARANTIVLAENYESTEREFWIRSRALFRIYWLLGGKWRSLGWLHFLPGYPGDLFYKWVSNHRHQFKFKGEVDLGAKNRFLP